MDVCYPADVESFRREVAGRAGRGAAAGVAGHRGHRRRPDAERFAAQWRQVLYRRGLLGVTWPEEYGGRGLSRLEQVVLVEELARAGVPTGGHNDTFSIKMVGNTLLRWGTEEQKRQFLPRILSGEDRWCQGFSEPGAGSDLASLATRAMLDGDEWVINGQKIWTSVAHRANWIFLLARTDPAGPRHRGITFLLCRWTSPASRSGRSARLTGDSEFNEVFFTGARTPANLWSARRGRAGRWP